MLNSKKQWNLLNCLDEPKILNFENKLVGAHSGNLRKELAV